MEDDGAMPWPMPNWPKVLLIDDRPHTAELIMRDLWKDQINVITARTLDEGFDLALKVHPDLIAVDYKFNGDTGIDFARRLREHPLLAGVPRILITESVVDDELRARAASEGYADCVQKPAFDRAWAKMFRAFMGG